MSPPGLTLLLRRLCFDWGMNTCIWCRVVSSIFLSLNETRVIGILVMPFERTKIDVNGGMFVCDCDHGAIKE